MIAPTVISEAAIYWRTCRTRFTIIGWRGVSALATTGVGRRGSY